jgi:hypothetical protein
MNEYIKETMTTWPKRLVVPLLLAALVLGGCDTTVTNPGPVQDSNIDDPGAFQALVNGAGRAVAQTMQWHAYTGGVVVLEIVGSGNITDHGVSLNHNEGKLLPDNQETDQWWNMANRARWTSEEAVRRIQSAGGFDTSQLGAEALVWVGFANRLMGEESCVSVIDGGAAGSRTVYFERAEPAFTEAMDIAGRIGETLEKRKPRWRLRRGERRPACGSGTGRAPWRTQALCPRTSNSLPNTLPSTMSSTTGCSGP